MSTIRFATHLVRVAVAAALGLTLGATTHAQPAKSCKPRFVGPLAVVANDDGRTLTLSQRYGFVDSRCVEWAVPPQTVVDGASIPQVFWTFTGGPLEGRYRNASVIHDWFCDRRSRPWQAVHQMFYEAMLAGGVEPKKANLMYLAVYYGGPRWSQATVRNMSLLDNGKCPACASVGSSGGNGAFASKATSQSITFEHDRPAISAEQAAALAQAVEAGEAATPEAIRALVDPLRPRGQACPKGMKLTADGKACA